MPQFENYAGYERELEFLKDNALKNSNRGLDVREVAKFIQKVAFSKKPKSSYTIGFDAKMAHFFSHFPQDFINFMMKKGMEYRFRK